MRHIFPRTSDKADRPDTWAAKSWAQNWSEGTTPEADHVNPNMAHLWSENGSFWDKHHVNSLCQLSVRSFGHFADLVLFIDNVALDFDRFQGITSWTIICIDIWFIGKSQIFLMSYPVKFWSNIYSNTPSNVHFSNLCTAAVNINNR